MNFKKQSIVVYFDQHLEWAAPKHWSKYTTVYGMFCMSCNWRSR